MPAILSTSVTPSSFEFIGSDYEDSAVDTDSETATVGSEQRKPTDSISDANMLRESHFNLHTKQINGTFKNVYCFGAALENSGKVFEAIAKYSNKVAELSHYTSSDVGYNTMPHISLNTDCIMVVGNGSVINHLAKVEQTHKDHLDILANDDIVHPTINRPLVVFED
ncbi:hypothetical protein IW140_001155 [Coemansia sp. RSA 1813]|nr:hypothetical protein LPJ74_000924 [Coemansia sp. RSA 1843]KAJ2092062.1 hypothetical protein IW138_001428 [Coemansia sp. RSA 986]KAJ2216602.1 hypothetical protein EV179_001141 [Coemansia sp. RSA 487]KAJ2572115.1 hypothetical protein IW140_001155 [Coemansia sp. RSA 1813]